MTPEQSNVRTFPLLIRLRSDPPPSMRIALLLYRGCSFLCIPRFCGNEVTLYALPNVPLINKWLVKCFQIFSAFHEPSTNDVFWNIVPAGRNPPTDALDRMIDAGQPQINQGYRVALASPTGKALRIKPSRQRCLDHNILKIGNGEPNSSDHVATGKHVQIGFWAKRFPQLSSNLIRIHVLVATLLCRQVFRRKTCLPGAVRTSDNYDVGQSGRPSYYRDQSTG
jgi:hypothetical protein